MAVDDVYELTLRGRLFNQRVENVFHFEQDVAFISTYPSPAHDLMLGWESQIFPTIRNIASSDVTFTELSVKNLFNVGDQADKAISVLGNQPSGGGAVETLPAFSTFPCALIGDNPAVKQGAKRFAGVIEGAQEDGVINTSGAQPALMLAVEEILVEPVRSFSLIDELFIPVIVKRIREGAPGAYTYRLPSTQLEKVVSHLLVASFNLLVSSQLSRKVGVGS